MPFEAGLDGVFGTAIETDRDNDKWTLRILGVVHKPDRCRISKKLLCLSE